MNVIELSGGLGNQMFQYALYLQMKKNNIEVMLDSSIYSNKNCQCELELPLAFGIQIEEANHFKTACARRLHALFPNIQKGKGQLSIYWDSIDSWQPDVLLMEDTLLSGYWQSEKYFDKAKEEVASAYKEFRGLSPKTREYADIMKSIDSVSVHIRRGDYLSGKNLHIYGGICTKDYYAEAIEYIRSKVKNPKFFLFTDDCEWTKAHINDIFLNDNDEVQLVDFNVGRESYQDMYLMSCCRHNIIANSSFSWWGAWLGQNRCGYDENHIVVCPDRWLNNHDMQDIYCDSWVRK